MRILALSVLLLIPALAAAATPAESEAACAAGKAEACIELADAVRTSEPKRAFDAWTRACELGNVTGCSELMVAYEAGTGVARDPKKSQELAEAGCEAGNGFGCGRAAKAYYFGKGVKKDIKRAIALYDRGCELGSPYSCSVSGTSYAFGDHVAKDVPKGKAMLEKACNVKFEAACKRLEELANPPKASSGGGGVCPGTAEIRCGGKCVSIWAPNSRNCGGCGNVCPSGHYCNQGTCQMR